MIPNILEQKIEQLLKLYGLKLSDSAKLAAAVQRMSDFYIENPESQTPWHEDWAQIAQVVYYLPLNFLRNQRVLDILKPFDFFSQTESLYEFGAGLSPSWLALKQANLNLKETHFSERSIEAIKLFGKLHTEGAVVTHKLPAMMKPNNVLICSYSLTELARHPDMLFKADRLILIEPSTRQDGRRLMELRSQLIDKGFYIWAPCTHQQDCPLLTQSKTDWCHDRVNVDMPVWFNEIEKHLPFKNKTVTLSYLVAARAPSPVRPGLARVVGDFLKEKGKTRQLICRGPKREFLTALTRKTEPLEFSRGDLLELSPNTSTVSDELRYDESAPPSLVAHPH